MFNFKKREESSGLPDLKSILPSIRDYNRPQLPAFQPLDEEKEEIHGLPSFPDSPMSKGFSQSIIKSAIEEESQTLPEWNVKSENQDTEKTMEMKEWTPTVSKSSAMMSEERIPKLPSIQQENSIFAKDHKKHLFVKLEKFKESRESLSKIADKLGQMDELLKMIKDVKIKEEEELNAWEKDIENIKARISFINKEIFENAY